MQNSTYTADTWSQVQASAIRANAAGVKHSCGASSDTNIDYLLTDDVFLRAVELLAQGVNFGDTINIQVLNANGDVIFTPVAGWNLSANSMQEVVKYESIVPQKLIAGMTLRIIYSNTSLLSTVSAAVNYVLPKILF
jgi:hypothetical protein